jgi:hypothetical protein
MDTGLMNAYIQKQNKFIGELVNQKLMLESQLEMAMQKIAVLEKGSEEDKEETYK